MPPPDPNDGQALGGVGEQGLHGRERGGLDGQGEVRVTGEERAKCDGGLEPGQGLAEADVGAAAEGQMSGLLAGDVESVGVGAVLGGVAATAL